MLSIHDFRTLIVTLYHAYVLLNLGLDFDIFTSSSLMGSFEFPAGILAVVCIHYLGRKLTSWTASLGTAVSMLVCAFLAGLHLSVCRRYRFILRK